MSFRARLTLFFIAIVIVPMIAVTVILFRLISDNETGKADARVGQAQTAAVRLYEDAARRGRGALMRVGDDARLFGLLARNRDDAAERRAETLLTRLRLQRILIADGDRVILDVGARDAIAPASVDVRVAGGSALGRLSVSVQRADTYARLVERVTALHVSVRRNGQSLASTLPGLDGARKLPRLGDVDVGGEEYRVVSFNTADFAGRVEVSVLSDRSETASDIAASRLLAAGLLAAFFVAAFVFAMLVSRSLVAQIGAFLVAARRVGAGDFTAQVPAEGHDEFAALGAEFNHMARQLEHRLDELRQERARLEDSLLRIGEAWASNLDRDALLEIVTRTAVDATRAGGGRISVRAARDGPLTQLAQVGDLSGTQEAVHAAERRALAEGRQAEAAAEGASALALPVRAPSDRRKPSGVLSVARMGEAFSQRERELFRYLVGQATVSIENVQLHERVQRQAVTDELTGLSNHRRFQEVMAIEIERARRFEHPVSLIMIDIDNFKTVNDAHGHQQGDLVLREVARVLRETSREIDEPARYGGEELAVALPQTELDGAFRVAERIREQIESLGVPLLAGEGELHITASLGVATLPDVADNQHDLIAAADAALYEAKRAGKNRTVRAQRNRTPAG